MNRRLADDAYRTAKELDALPRYMEGMSEEMKEKMNVPAYQRKNVVLNEPQHSSEPAISKYNLSNENEILGNNRYLHDNVD